MANMDREDLQALADSLLDQHGVPRCPVSLSTARLTGGRYRFRDRSISVSAHMEPADREATLRHEVAHAIVHFRLGNTRQAASHGYVWKSWAMQVGAVPQACSAPTTEALKKNRVEWMCPSCGLHFWKSKQWTNKIIARIQMYPNHPVTHRQAGCTRPVTLVNGVQVA